MTNTVILVGRTTKNIELREAGKSKVSNFSLAVTNNYKNANGKYDAQFFNCEAWGPTAEFLEKYVPKGTQIGVKGSLKNDPYTDKDGKNVTRTYVRVDSVSILSKPNTAPAAEEEPVADEEGVPFPFA